ALVRRRPRLRADEVAVGPVDLPRGSRTRRRGSLRVDHRLALRERGVLLAVDGNGPGDHERGGRALDAPLLAAVDRDADAVALGEALDEHPALRVVRELQVE